MLVRVFLHADFISVMKIVQNNTIFVKNGKRIEKWIFLVISVNFFEIFTETLEQNIRNKSKNMFFEMEKRRQIKQN